MIEKKIHYCWFGRNKMPLQEQRCLASWEYHLSNYEIICWNEDNFNIDSHPFTLAAYKAGMFAFVADYVRMQVLYTHGGIYLDTDVLVYKNFNALLNNDLFIGLEDKKRFGTSVIGAIKNNWLPQQMLKYYNSTVFTQDNLSNLVNVNEVSRLLLEYGFCGYGQEEQIDKTLVLALGVFADAKNVGNCAYKPIAKHLFAGSWKGNIKKSALSKTSKKVRKLPLTINAMLHLCIYKALILITNILKCVK